MKIKSFMILTFFGLVLISCRDNINQQDSENPNIVGTYTKITGNLNGMLTIDNSPYLINANVSVLSGDTLTIKPGVSLFFKQDARLIILGTILAIGMKEEPILFSYYPDEYWLGISIKNGSSLSRFSFCIIEGVYQPYDGEISYGAIEVTNSEADIRNCILRYNFTPYDGGLCLINSQATVVNNIFRSNDANIYGGAMYVQNSIVSIINNSIVDNFSHFKGGAIVFENPTTTEIQNNIFYYNNSFQGDKRIDVIEGDSTKIHQQYNYLDPDSTTPGFISSTDLHLTSLSVCNDSGNPSEEYNDYNGTRNDQGAYGGPGGNW